MGLCEIFKDWINIYTWKELWMAVGIPICLLTPFVYIGIMAVLLTRFPLPYPLRSVVGLLVFLAPIAFLSLFVAWYNPESRC